MYQLENFASVRLETYVLLEKEKNSGVIHQSHTGSFTYLSTYEVSEDSKW